MNIDLPEHAQARTKYNYEVPVGLMKGKEVFKYWVNEDKLVKVLNSATQDEESQKEDK